MPGDRFDRAVVAVVDIESFTTHRPGDQGALVELFIEMLNAGIDALTGLTIDAWSTGDGAIVSLGRVDPIDDETVSRFLDFVVDLIAGLLRAGVVVRTAINYSERDRIVTVPSGSSLRGDFVQVGDGINDAARIITFCEPRELLISDSFFRLLRQLDPLPHVFHRNDTFRTKHGQLLQTHSYVPSADETGIFYSPNSPLHRYKRFSSFPPIKSETLDYFVHTGLEYEIRKVVSRAYAAMETINDTKTFMSSSEVLKVLIQMQYDQDDDVIIVSRNDQRGFWNQQRKSEYLSYLRNSCADRKYINQRRILVYPGTDDEPGVAEGREVLAPEEAALIAELKTLHRPNTFFKFPSTFLFQYEDINALKFGFTLSRKYGFAVIPVPAPEDADPGDLNPASIAGLLSRYENYDPLEGPMKAVITADERFIATLMAQYEEILRSPHIRPLS